MHEFWSLFRQSIIVQALLALMCTGAILYAQLAGQTIPSELWTIEGLILGWYFGAKAQAGTTEALRQVVSIRKTDGETR